MTTLLAVLALLAVGGMAGIAGRRRRRRVAGGLRARWGLPVARNRNLTAIAAGHRSRAGHWDTHQGALDDRTWDDLDLDAVFAALDRTESTLGQHALYHRLRTAPVADHLAAFDALVTRLGTDTAVRQRAQAALSRLQDPHGYDLWWVAREQAIDIRLWYVLFPALSAAALLLVVSAPFFPQVIPALVGMFAVNVVVRYLTDRRIGTVAAAFRQVAPVITAGQALSVLDGDDVRPLLGTLPTDAKGLRRLKSIARWTCGDPFMLPVQPGSVPLLLSDVVSAAYEYMNLLFLLDANGVYFGASEIRARAPALLRLTAAAGDVDAAISVASVRAGRADWTRPRFVPAGARASWRDVHHPLIADAVPNTISLAPGHGVLVTGSNMSGKSTFLRTIGVTTVMAQTLDTCFAAEYEAPVLTVRSCIGRSDDIVAGKSYYIAEVETLLSLVESSTGPSSHLFLLDELFRGTNAVERIAAGHAVLTELVIGGAGARLHVVVAATHDAELVDLSSDRYEAWHFGDHVGADGLAFDHRLRRGRATTRNAIALLRLHGAPDRLTDLAARCASALDRQRGGAITGR